jgi:hypothetical protein
MIDEKTLGVALVAIPMVLVLISGSSMWLLYRQVGLVLREELKEVHKKVLEDVDKHFIKEPQNTTDKKCDCAEQIELLRRDLEKMHRMCVILDETDTSPDEFVRAQIPDLSADGTK